MSCCDACASGNACDCAASSTAKTCAPCAPFSPRAKELLSQDRDPAVAVVIPAGTTVLIAPPSRGGAVYNYSCARYILKVTPDLVATATASDAASIRWIQTIDPTGAAARQEGLESRTGQQFICGDECKSFPVDATVVGQADVEVLELEVENTALAAGMNASLEIYGRAICLPMYQPVA